MIGEGRLERIDGAFGEVKTPAGVGNAGIREDRKAGGGGGWGGNSSAPGSAYRTEAEDVG